MKLLSEEYLSSICEVKTMENEIVCTGIISDITDEYIDVSGRTGAMGKIGYREEVKISIFNVRAGFCVLVGMVYLYSPDFMRITEITTVLDYERRHFFRIATEINAHMYLKDPDITLVADNPRKAVKVKNMSLGGCMVGSKELLADEGTHCFIEMKLNGGRLERIPVVMKRVEKDLEGIWNHGCSFEGDDKRQKDQLCAYIFRLQREQIHKNAEKNQDLY